MTEEMLRGRAWVAQFEEMVDMERAAMGGFGPFERHWLTHKRSPESAQRALARARGEFLGMPNSPYTGVVGQPRANPSSFTTVNSTNSETNLWTPAIWTPIPANDMEAGKVYSVQGGGVLGTSSSAPTATWTPRSGQSGTPSSNVTLGASTATTMIASLAAVPFMFLFTLTIRALGLAASGASGTGNGFVVIGGLTTAAGIVQSIGAAVPTTIDNTAATGLILSLTWGTNHANNTATCQWTTPVRSFN